MAAENDVLAAPPPRFSLTAAEDIARQHFDITGFATPLNSERDQNFRIADELGRAFALKVSNAVEDPAVVEMQTAAMLHITRTDPELPIAQPWPTVDGGFLASVEGPEGAAHLATLSTFLEGDIVEATELTPEALRGVGGCCAKLGRALRGFFHPAAGRTLLWDTKRAANLRPLVPLVEDPDRRAIVTNVLDRFEERALPALEGLRAQVIHNDLTLDNALFDSAGRITGIVDFGDMVHTPLVCDLSTTLGSLLRGRSDPYEVVAATLGGYLSVATLEQAEAALLSDLIAARLATTVVISAWRVRRYPENAEYITGWDEGSWHVLELLDRAGPEEFTRRFEEACVPRLAPERATIPDDELLERRRRVLGGNLDPLSYSRPLHIVRGDGVCLFDAEGRAYLDAYNNVPVVGHCHPRIVEAMAKQARTLNTNTRYLHENVVELAERLTASMPDELDTCIFVNSGSEANDLAWRLATVATGEKGGIVTAFAYHGVTAAVVDLTPEDWLPGEHPLNVATVPAPDTYRRPAEGGDWGEGGYGLDEAIAALASNGYRPALVLMDSFFTSDGIFVPPPGYLQGVVHQTHEAGALLAADEVQAGFGRSGSMWNFAASGIVPDIVTLGKPMGNGHPIAAVVTRADIVERFASGREFFSTFGGNPVSCAAGLAVLDVLEEEQLLPHVLETGEYLRRALRGLAGRHVLIGDVRGAGLMTGVELVLDRETKDPASHEAAAVVNAMREGGVLIQAIGPADNVLKIRPPLVFTTEDADSLVRTLDDALSSLRP